MSIELNSRIEDFIRFLRETKHVEIKKTADNMAEDLAEIMQNSDSDEENHFIYDRIYEKFRSANLPHREIVKIMLKKLHLLLFGPMSSPILSLELLLKDENQDKGIRAQSNTLLQILTGQPDEMKHEAIWFYPKPVYGILLGGDHPLHPFIEKALLHGNFGVRHLISHVNRELYYEISLKCKQSDLPLKRQFATPHLYEKEQANHIVNTMF